MKAVIQENIKIAPLLSFRAGQGRVRYFCEVQSRAELKEILTWAGERDLRYFTLGGGSNVLFSDQGFDGLIFKLNFREIKISKEDDNFIFLKVSAGLPLAELISFCTQQGWAGLDCFVGIPGTVGGAVYGNAGWPRQGVSIGDLVTRVLLCHQDGAEEERGVDFLDFSYRNSWFKNRAKNAIILEVELKLRKASSEEILSREKQILVARQKSIPSGFSAGCVFKNVRKENGPRDFSSDSLIPLTFREKGVIPAGWLIDQCGLKGYQRGGAKISEKHANFIINFHQATAKDIYFLIKLAQEKVLEKFGFNLSLEIEYVL
jgi:UDP-N-acetylmuramate dehydrogenase